MSNTILKQPLSKKPKIKKISLMKSLSIRLKIIGYFLCIVIAVISLMSMVAATTIRRQLLSMQQSKAMNVGANLAVASEDLLLAKQWDKLQLLLIKAKLHDRDLQYAILTLNDGQCVATTEKELEGRYLNVTDFEKKVMAVNGISVIANPKQEDIVETVIPLVKENNTSGILRLGYTRRFISQEVLRSIIIIILFGLVALVCGVILYHYVLQRHVVNPLSRIMAYASRITEGDLSQQVIEVNDQDEIGELAAVLSKMVHNLREMVSSVSITADKVARALGVVSSTMQEINSSTQEIASAIGHVSKGATSQAEQIENTFQVMGKSAISLKEVVANAQSANKAVSKTTTSAENARITAEEAVNRIEKLTSTVLETTMVVQSLGKMSQQISEITETITSIADQTNLLALNAAIEAARAGEAGRGFAVVAEEVRKLAEGSAEAVRKIGGLIKAIQAETNRAVSSIEVSSKEVQGGKEQVAKIAQVLAEINKVAKDATYFVNQIALSGQERVEEIDRIVSSINEVATIAKESAATVEEVSATSQSQTASMEEVSASAQELVQSAAELKELVSRFRL